MTENRRKNGEVAHWVCSDEAEGYWPTPPDVLVDWKLTIPDEDLRGREPAALARRFPAASFPGSLPADGETDDIELVAFCRPVSSWQSIRPTPTPARACVSRRSLL